MLNDTLIRSLKPAEKPQKHFDGGGLFLFIPPTGSKLWRMAYRFEGKSKLLSFGDYPAVTLKDARERRDEAKKLLAQSVDPSLHKKQLREARLAEEANTFQSIAMEWYEHQTTDLNDKYRKHIIFRLSHYLLPALGKTNNAARLFALCYTMTKKKPAKSRHAPHEKWEKPTLGPSQNQNQRVSFHHWATIGVLRNKMVGVTHLLHLAKGRCPLDTLKAAQSVLRFSRAKGKDKEKYLAHLSDVVAGTQEIF